MSIAQTLTLLNLTDVICLCCSLHDCLFLRLSSTQCGSTGPCVVTNPLRTRGHSPRFYTFAPGRPQAGARGVRAKKSYPETLYFLQFVICYLVTLKFNRHGTSCSTTVGRLSTRNTKYIAAVVPRFAPVPLQIILRAPMLLRSCMNTVCV